LDEAGIPADAKGRVEIAKKILATAAEYGIPKKDIVFDTLAMTVSADNHAARATLDALSEIKNDLGCHTSLGVSNVSFGLPHRDAVNATFFAMALTSGLSTAIMNPYSADMMKTYFAYRALNGQDENCADYVAAAAEFAAQEPATTSTMPQKSPEEYASELQKAVIKGFKERAGELTAELLKTVAPLDIVNHEIIPALNVVGDGFEKKTVYLPQLLIAAEAAKHACEQIKSHLCATEAKTAQKAPFVLATVHGDIHDIGKNIVKLLLENYGFPVIDLGKDVTPEDVVSAVVAHHAPLVGLSALMTTTVPAMERTIKLLREQAPWCRIVVGGAVLTAEYAAKIGADAYAKDAMEGVRFAQSIIG
jgi:5-methyltetrahydrofolate--homocysteine methyltransferase